MKYRSRRIDNNQRIAKTHLSIATNSAPKSILDLQAGNANYAAGTFDTSAYRADLRQMASTKPQRPKAAIVGCSDSRAPVEVVFGQGIGDLFVVRLAGNRCGTTALASLEYAVDVLKTPLLVVLGHTQCGAVKAAMGRTVSRSPHMSELFSRIRPTVGQVKAPGANPSKEANYAEAVRLNAEESLREIMQMSDLLSDRVASGALTATWAVLDIYTGIVEWAK